MTRRTRSRTETVQPPVLNPKPSSVPSEWDPTIPARLAHRLEDLARASLCREKAVAALLLDGPDRELASGVNGRYWEGDACGSRVPGYNRCVHAEQRCSVTAKAAGFSLAGASIWTSFSPCLKCATGLVDDGVESAVFLQPLRDPQGLLHLLKAGVSTFWYDGARLVPVPAWPVLEKYLQASTPDAEAAALRSADLSAAQRTLLAQQRYLAVHKRNKDLLEEDLQRFAAAAPFDGTRKPSMLRLMALVELEEVCLTEAERGNILERHP